MQEIVADTINDLEFLKLQLTTEIDGIKINIGDLRIYPKVQNYISLVKKRENLKQNNIYKDTLKAEIKDKIDTLIDTYIEVKQYIESIKALQEYEEDLTNLDNLISIDGVIYNKVKDDKIHYSAKEVLKHLMALKERAGLPLILTIEELNRYIDAVRKSLQDNTHYEDDKVIDEILSFKVYQNPQNYDIKNVRELPSLDLEYQYESYLKGTKATYKVTSDNNYELVSEGKRGNDILPSIDLEYLYEKDNLTEREKEAFFGTEAHKALGISKEQAKVKRIGAKKNV